MPFKCKFKYRNNLDKNFLNNDLGNMIKANVVATQSKTRKYYITHVWGGYNSDSNGKISIQLQTPLSGYQYDEYAVFSCLTAYSTGGIANLIARRIIIQNNVLNVYYCTGDGKIPAVATIYCGFLVLAYKEV